MTESRREIWTRAASETIARQQKFDDDNLGDRAYLLVSDTYSYRLVYWYILLPVHGIVAYRIGLASRSFGDGCPTARL